jgi:hypothetical protein
MTADVLRHGVHNAVLEPVLDWVLAFANAGAALAAAAGQGLLGRGIRDLLAHHILFSANRLGLPASTQSILSATASYVVLERQ